ncbi:heterocyst differentiation protein HetZ [Kamptonema animale CS-326]|jgi:DNA-binding protein Fis|uniref:heterocyst differentiation protein HetZ n=1 Tax=Kamptonema animale TaxID=92934 RepID=UPI002330456D|nr:heterocyst differentiation protein HetZ [Kamptonema animale]MDB9512622.1 heterocyst differentiation protein HetZ [Kamptonema animale CS-326]
MREICQSVEKIFQLLLDELQKSTRASEQNCREVAERLTAEVTRICTESKRIQASGEVEHWAITLAQHRLQQCLQYYQLGSGPGRVELHSTLSAIVYRYITPPQVQSSYQARLELIKDFLQGFYLEALNAFRREAQLPATYSPRTRLELAEYMAFAERFGKRRIPLSRGRSQQLIVLRSQTFSQQQPHETSVDMEQAADGAAQESDSTWNDATVTRVREAMVGGNSTDESDSLRQAVIEELMTYLEERNQKDCADYFALRLQDLPTNEIEAILGLTPRQRDYLQQRFKYHLLRFALSHRWELVHQWLESDLEKNLGLIPQQWDSFLLQIGSEQESLLRLKQQGMSDSAIAQTLGSTVAQVQKRWFKLLELAWEIRNRSGSGEGASTDE